VVRTPEAKGGYGRTRAPAAGSREEFCTVAVMVALLGIPGWHSWRQAHRSVTACTALHQIVGWFVGRLVEQFVMSLA